MAEAKRYYWLKFRDDFFDSKRIKKLRRMAGGDTYVIIYLKMQLKALRTGGVLEFTGIEKEFAEELALDIDESVDDVRVVLAFLLGYGLCECSDNVHYYLPYVTENTGSETAAAQRMRDHRDRLKLAERNNVTPLLRECCVEKEIEKEKESEIEIDAPKGARGRFTPPTLEEVKSYVQEKGLTVNAEDFYTYFTTPNDKGETWIDSRGNKVKNWKQKLQTWSRMNGTASPRARSRNTLLNYHEEGVNHSNLGDIGFDLEEL